jgi:hypothetical protein
MMFLWVRFKLFRCRLWHGQFHHLRQIEYGSHYLVRCEKCGCVFSDLRR